MSLTDDFLKGLDKRGVSINASSKNNSNTTKKKKKKEETVSSADNFTNDFLNGLQKRNVQVGTDDFAPIKTVTTTKKKKDDEKRTWFNSGEFADGYDFGDITKTILGSSTDLVEDLSTGIIGMGEKAWDGLLMLGNAMAGQQMNQAAQNQMIYNAVTGKETDGILERSLADQRQIEKETAEYVKKDLYDEEKIAKKIITNPFEKATNINVEDTSVFGEKSDALIQSGGQLLGTAGLQMVGVPWFVTTGATAYGSQAEQALNEGATFNEANASALISAGAEILTEKLSGGINFGGKTLDDVLVKSLTERISSKALKTLTNLGIDAVGEGSEEVVSSIMSNLGTALYKEDKVSDILFSEEAVDEYVESFIGGAVLGGVSSGFRAVREGGKEDYTENEQKVIDKEIENRIAEIEQDGNKLTKKEKSKIREDVLSDLDKGAISIDTIESVLGGETYNNYKSTVEREDSLLKEFEELGNKTNATLKEQTRYKELSDLVEEYKSKSQRDQLKSQLGNEVFGIVKGSRLAESYNEQTRKSQYYETDLTKYDEKQQAIVQKAIDSKVLNNSNRTHEFVDMVSKLSAEKGVLFDFTNNEKLKESGFAVEGKTVNGFVNENGDIVLNMDSHKAHRSVVGHEITHILEGTELYTELQEVVKQYATTKGEYAERMQSLRDLYTGVYEGKDFDEKIRRELTADIVGDYLFTDEKFINSLSTEKPNLFKRIYNEIKYLYKVATAGSKEARELEKVKRAFDKAYKQSGKTNTDTKYSLSNKNAWNNIKNIQGLEGYSVDEVVNMTKDHINNILLENGEQVEIVAISPYGSRAKGTANNKSDLDIVVQYEGDIREDDMFNMLNDEDTKLYFDDIEVDINPIKAEDSGSIEEYLSRVYDYDKHNAKYSLSDSDGKQLTKEQQDYFKDSKVRDENGNLKVMYHGSQDAGFHTFDSSMSDDDTSFFFVDRNDVAATYSGTSETYEAKTIRTTEDMNTFLAEIGYDDYKAVEKNGKFELLENNEHVAYSDTAQGLYEEFCWYESVGEGDANYKVYLNLTNPLEIDGKGDNWNSIAIPKELQEKMWEHLGERVSATTTRNYSTFAKEQGYDGVIFNNIRDNGGYSNGSEGASTVAIAFESNQIKSVANTKPTKNADIRYSLSATDKNYLSAVEKGDTETAQKLVDEVAKENGYTIKAYHGTKNAGFTRFEYSPDRQTGDDFGKAYYFTTDYEKAQGYSYDPEKDTRIQEYKNNRKQLLQKFLKTRSEEDKNNYLNYKQDGKTLFDLLDDESYITDGGEVKELFLKFDNPLRVNAKGKYHYEVYENYFDQARKNGNDGIIVKNVIDNPRGEHRPIDVYIAFNSNQMKSADTVTYDDNGNVIPLSERFKADNEDIRYSLSDSEGRELSPAIQKRFGNTKVVDENGYLKPVYHGTATGEFTIFDKSKGSVEGDFGSGFYFTDNEADVTEHYEGGGPDFENKIARRAEQIESEEEIDYDEAEERARQELFKGSHKFEVYLNIENPAIVGETFLFDNESYLEEYDENDFDDYDEYIAEVEQLVSDDIEKIIWEVERNIDVYSTDGLSNILFEAYYEGGIGIEELKSKINELYLEDSNGNLVANEVTRQIIESLGYDGIIDPTVSTKWNMDMEEGTTHYIVFKPNQIKSVTNQNPTDNEDINLSLSKENDIAPIKSGNVPLKDLAYQPTVSKMEQVQEDILPIKEVVAKNTTTIPEEFAPMTEAEFNELNDNRDRLNSYTDNDAPPIKEAPYYERDTITLPKARVDRIAKSIYDYVFPKHGEKKGLKDVVSRYASGEIADRYALFDEIKKVYGEKTIIEEDVDLLEVQNVLRAYPLKITDDIKAEYPEYADFMRKHKGRLNFANKGEKVDQAYQDLSSLYPGYFPDTIWNPADQFARMVEVSEMDRFATDTWELLDEDIQRATDIIADEVARYKETQLQKLVERENRAFYKMSPKYWEALMPPIAEDVSENVTKDNAKVVKKQSNSKMQDEKIAQILMNEPKIDKKKGLKRDWERFTSNFVDKATPIETIALKTGNRELDGKYNTIRYADTKAQTLIGEGADGVKSINDIFGQVGSEADLEKFYNYLYHKHNVDRMSLESRETENLARLSEEMHNLKLDNLEEKQLYAISREKITDNTTEKRANIIETVKEYLKSLGVKNKPVYGDSVTAQISQEIVDKYEFNNPEFVQYAEDVYNYNRLLRDELVKGGVISQETADLFEELYPHYVPIRRVNHNGSGVNVPLDTRKTGINAPIKRAQGGNSDILPLAQTMAQRTLQTYKAVAKNRFGVELKNTLGTTIESTETDVDEIVESVDTHEELLKEGKHGANPTFTVFENGEKVTFEITEAIYDALKPTSEALSKTYNVLSTPTGIFKKLVTEYNPAFMLTNPIKDTQDVLINSQHPLKTYKNYPKAIAGLLSKKGRWYNEYMSNGGKDDSYFDRETNTFIEEKSGVKKVVGFPFEKISEANNFLERLPRLAEYIASREMGRSIDVAMLDSARVTTNFRAGGDITKFLNRNGVTFLNPSVQGAVQQVRNVREAKANGLKGWALLATKVALAGLPGMLLNGLLWDDDEDYEELSDYVKQNYYIVWKNEDGKFIRVPKGRALAVIQNAFTQVQNAVTGDDEVDINSFLELVANNLAPNNPLENNILAPIMQVKNNKTWYGEDLVPSRLADLPAKEQFDESTDKFSKWLGGKINKSPVKINYLLNQYSGGVGDMILPMLTPEAESGKNSVLSNFTAPIRDKFTTDSVMNNQNVSNFYEVSDELKVNANSSEATEEDILKNKYFNAIRTEMSALYKEKREIQNNEYLNDSEKYNRVREVQEEINALSEEALNSYNSVAVEGKYAEIGDKQYRMNNDNEWQKISDEELEKQNEVIGILGITKSQYWNNKKEYDMKALNPEKYKVLQEQGISVEDYKENYEEMAHIYTDDYSWASDNPEKYTLSKAVTDDVSQYKQYTSDLYNIKADKDSNGKSITGSRKEKVHDYIFDLDIEDGAKYILFKSEYNADDTYNYEIINYLNEREDISYSDMETILKELGFEVDSQGNISW